jgi:hypothetical protein
MRAAVFLFLLLLAAPFPAQAQFLQLPAQKENEPPATQLSLAMKYADRCMNNLFPGISPPARNDFCSCSADLARQKLKMDELALLAEGKGSIPNFDRKEFNLRVEKQINAPCIHFIVRESTNESCLRDESTMHFFVSQPAYEAMCSCLSDNMGGFMEIYGMDMVAVMLERRGMDETKDLLGVIETWPDYTHEYTRWRDECLNTYAYK